MLKIRVYTVGFAFLLAVAVWSAKPAVTSAYYSYQYYPYTDYTSSYGEDIDFAKEVERYRGLADYYESLADHYETLADLESRETFDRTGYNVPYYYPQFSSPWTNTTTYPYSGGNYYGGQYSYPYQYQYPYYGGYGYYR